MRSSIKDNNFRVELTFSGSAFSHPYCSSLTYGTVWSTVGLPFKARSRTAQHSVNGALSDDYVCLSVAIMVAYCSRQRESLSVMMSGAGLIVYCVSQKIPLQFSDIFPKRLTIFNRFVTHLLYVPLYTRLLIIFIQLFPTLTKLCHTKRDYPANFFTFH